MEAFGETDITFTAPTKTAEWYHRLVVEGKVDPERYNKTMTAGLKAYLAAVEKGMVE